MNKALRRHLGRRKVQQRRSFWAQCGVPYAHWMKHTGTICSCGLCRNVRHWTGIREGKLTLQELRARDDERSQILDLSDPRELPS